MRTAATVLLALLALLPGAVGLPLAPQDDAGSGGDAGDRLADALPIGLGTYDARLFGIPRSYGVRDPLLDAEDWYRVEVEAGRVLQVQGQLLGGSGSLFVDLRRPDGALAGWGGFSASPQTVEVVTDVPGAWAIRVYAYARSSPGGDYRFTVSAPAVVGHAEAGPNPGWTAVGVRVEPGGLAVLSVTTTMTTGAQTSRSDMFVLDEAGNVLWHVPSPSPEATEGAEAKAGPVVLQSAVRHEGGASARSIFTWRFSTAGTYHVVTVVHAAEAYATASAASLRNATVLGVTRGDAVVALRPVDFAPVASAAAAATDASVGGAAALQVQHRLVAAFSCGQEEVSSCRVTRPDGFVASFTRAWTVGGGAAGEWTFHRDVGAAPFLSRYPLLAADVQLPS